MFEAVTRNMAVPTFPGHACNWVGVMMLGREQRAMEGRSSDDGSDPDPTTH